MTWEKNVVVLDLRLFRYRQVKDMLCTVGSQC